MRHTQPVSQEVQSPEDFYAREHLSCCVKDYVFNVKLHAVETWRCRAVSLVFYPDKLLRQGECLYFS